MPRTEREVRFDRSPNTKRQLNGWVSAEVYDRVARAARKANMSRSSYAAAFIAANIDVIDPEGAAP